MKGRFVEECYVEDELDDEPAADSLALAGIAVLVIAAIAAGVALAMLIGRTAPT